MPDFHTPIQKRIAALTDDQVVRAFALLPDEFQVEGLRREVFFRDHLAAAVQANADATGASPEDVLELTLDLLSEAA